MVSLQKRHAFAAMFGICLCLPCDIHHLKFEFQCLLPPRWNVWCVCVCLCVCVLCVCVCVCLCVQVFCVFNLLSCNTGRLTANLRLEGRTGVHRELSWTN